MNLVGMISVWVSASFCYYLINFLTKYLPGNMYLNNVAQSSSELISYFTAGIFFNKIGLRPTLWLSYVIALAGMISLLFY